MENTRNSILAMSIDEPGQSIARLYQRLHVRDPGISRKAADLLTWKLASKGYLLAGDRKRGKISPTERGLKAVDRPNFPGSPQRAGAYGA